MRHRRSAVRCGRAFLGIAHDWFLDAAVVLRGLGREDELTEVAESVPTPTPWRDAGLALGAGDALAAAEILRDMGARPFEADALLAAARAGIDVDLAPAIEFFREVDASAHLAEAESLRATTRSA